MKELLLFFTASLVIFISCSRKNTELNLLADTTIVNFQADYLIIQQENQLLRLDSLEQQHRMDSLYHYYNITKDQVDKTLIYYKKDINRWMEFYQKVTQRLEYLQSRELHPPNL